jgi:hypothetical protein
MRERRRGAPSGEWPTINAARHASLLISNQVRTFETWPVIRYAWSGHCKMAGMVSPLSRLARNSHSKHSRSCGVFAFTLGVAPVRSYKANLYVNIV